MSPFCNIVIDLLQFKGHNSDMGFFGVSTRDCAKTVIETYFRCFMQYKNKMLSCTSSQQSAKQRHSSAHIAASLFGVEAR